MQQPPAYADPASQVEADIETCLGLLRTGRRVFDFVTDVSAERVEQWRKFATGGHAGAKWLLGLALTDAADGEPDEEGAFELYVESADAGFTSAQHLAALCLMNGAGTDIDAEAAIRRLEVAASQGEPLSEVLLGACLLDGDDVDPNPERAIELFGRAAREHDNPDGDFHLGQCYLNGDGVDQDVAVGAENLRRAAERGHVGAQATLGDCYLYGDGVEKSATEAVTWYRRAAEFDNAEALWSLSARYEIGDGVEKNSALSLEFLERAADNSHADALYFVGMYCEKGRSLPKDLHRALECYERSSDLGNTDAGRALKRLRWKLDGGETRRRTRVKKHVDHRIVRASEVSPPPDPSMRGISLRQPWAELVLQGRKTVEVRSKPTRVRGRMYIYASLKRLEPFDEEELEKLHGLDLDTLPRGAIVGTVEIVGARELEFDDSEAAGFEITGTFRQHAWLLEKPERFDILIATDRQAQPSFFYPFSSDETPA
jgi:TPR repeat protein